MDTVGVVVVDVLAEESSQVVLVQDDDVIEELATYGTDDTFRGPVFPWASKGCPLRVDLEALDRARHWFSVVIRMMRALVSSEIGGLPGPGVEMNRQ